LTQTYVLDGSAPTFKMSGGKFLSKFKMDNLCKAAYYAENIVVVDFNTNTVRPSAILAIDASSTGFTVTFNDLATNTAKVEF
jgi:hypothetical protein